MTVTYKNDAGRVMTFGSEPPYLLEHIDTQSCRGLAEVNMHIGGAFDTMVTGFDRRIIPVDVSLADYTWNRRDYQTAKNRLLDLINLAVGNGTLFYTNDLGECYQIRCRPTDIPTEENKNNSGTGGTFRIQFETTEIPLWSDINQRIVPIGQEKGGIIFPMKLEPRVKFGKLVNRFIEINDTSMVLPVSWMIKGPAPPIKIVNHTTGEHLKFVNEIPRGQQMYIDTYNKRVVMEDSDTGIFIQTADNRLTYDSWFFDLMPGQNDIEVLGADDTTPTLIGYMSYRLLKGGV